MSIDLTRTHGPFSYTATLFGSQIAHPIKVDRPTYVLQNLVTPTSNMGVELLALVRRSPLAITASYTTFTRVKRRRASHAMWSSRRVTAWASSGCGRTKMGGLGLSGITPDASG